MRIACKPVDLLSLAFIALLAGLTLAAIPAMPHWPWLLMRYVLLGAAVIAIRLYTTNADSWKPAMYFAAFLPALVIPVVFDSLGDLIPWVHPRLYDPVLIAADHALFGVHPTVWLERFIHPVLTTVLQVAYTSYYPMAVVLAAVLMIRGKRAEFDEAVFGIILCFYLSYVGYLLVPALGPRFALAHAQTTDLQAGPLVLAIQSALNNLENTKMDAFPSGHTAVALTTLFYAWKSREKVLSAVLLPVVLGLIVSTVYLRYHYVIDVICGILLAVVTLLLAPRIERRLSRWSHRPQQ